MSRGFSVFKQILSLSQLKARISTDHFLPLALGPLSPRITGITRIPSNILLRSRSGHAELAASLASGIAAASFRSAAEKDTAESPTAIAGTHKGKKLRICGFEGMRICGLRV